MHLAFYPTSGESARCERHGKVFSKASSDGQIPHVASTGVLRIIPTEEVYLLTGQFDYQRVLAFVESAILETRAAGYERMFITGESRWWLPSVPGAEKWMDYEALLNQVVEKYPGVTIVCQYDLRRFDAPTMLNLLLAHPSVHLPSGRVPGFYSSLDNPP